MSGQCSHVAHNSKLYVIMVIHRILISSDNHSREQKRNKRESHWIFSSLCKVLLASVNATTIDSKASSVPIMLLELYDSCLLWFAHSRSGTVQFVQLFFILCRQEWKVPILLPQVLWVSCHFWAGMCTCMCMRAHTHSIKTFISRFSSICGSLQ